MLQHSIFNIPDRHHGYSIDDNVRALILMSTAEDLACSDRTAFGAVYAAFIQSAWNDETASFRNFMGFDRHWLEESGSPDSNGRTFWALSIAERQHSDPQIRRWAATLIDRTIGHFCDVRSPRAMAFILLGGLNLCQSRADPGKARYLVDHYSDQLLFRYNESATDTWKWFETVLSYDNCRIAEALVYAGIYRDSDRLKQTASNALYWIMELQLSPDGMFCPVGTQGFGKQFETPHRYDQQPLEALAAIEGCIAGYTLRTDNFWLNAGEAAFAWFQGKNDHGIAVSDPKSGECYDGINPEGVNLNQGAESVLAWQMATRKIRTLRKLASC